jgi:endonuclease YncB( thermonuclease family)
MTNWGGRGRKTNSWSKRKPKPAPFWSRRRRRSLFRIGGLPLAIVVLVGMTVARDGVGAIWPQSWPSVAQSSSAAVSSPGQHVGIASVIDGDTIEIHGRRIRLDGIDAPESSQLCARGGVKERCGQAAALHLADMIGRQTVRCETHDVDRYGRDIATCWLGGKNLNEAMVAAGQAVAYRRYSRAYVGAEDAARGAGVGVWGTTFEMPWDYRR